MTDSVDSFESETLRRAKAGDINAFYVLYASFRDELKSFLYRLLADRSDAEDLAQDTFVRAFEKLGLFEGRSSLKTWVFSIGAHLALDVLRHRQRWPTDILDLARNEAIAHEEVRDNLMRANRESPHGAFELTEHVDFCFTCISKTLPLEQQLALLLRDVYGFQTSEVARIMDFGEGAVKNHTRNARQTMARVFENRCALVRQDGPCHQCSQLNGWLNPKQIAQEQLVSVASLRTGRNENRKRLLAVRESIVRNVNPLRARGSDLHEAFLSLHRYCAAEIEALKPVP